MLKINIMIIYVRQKFGNNLSRN